MINQKIPLFLKDEVSVLAVLINANPVFQFVFLDIIKKIIYNNLLKNHWTKFKNGIKIINTQDK